jgi:hypothetical protein
MNTLFELVLGIVALNICLLLFLYYLAIRPIPDSVGMTGNLSQDSKPALERVEQHEGAGAEPLDGGKDLSGGHLGI